MKALVFSGAAALAAIAAPAYGQTGEILDRFAADFLEDSTFTETVEFGVEVEGDWWTVSLDHDAGTYTVTHAEPETPTFYFTVEAETLGKVDRGEMTALTAMGKAFSTDVTPMDIELMEGAGFDPSILSLTFHFWSRGTPETVNYLTSETRFIHGSNGGLIYYQPGFRSGFFRIAQGHHVNENPDSRTNPFPSMVIVTSGEGIARLDGVDHILREGDIILIPAGMSHEFFNEHEEPVIGLLFMFGEGA